MMPKENKRAFTLIELLVVISIIALLLAILMPALGRVRSSARVLTCSVNLKQMGTYVALYQAESNGAVPVMLNRFDASANVPARARLLSLAFHAFSPETANLASVENGRFDPDKPWGWNTDRRVLGEYFEKHLPDFYVCPFVRGRGTEVEYQEAGTVTLTGPNGSVSYRALNRTMAGESYAVWRWERRRGNESEPNTILTPNHPYGFPHGSPQYGALSWNSFAETLSTNWDVLNRNPVRWSRTHLSRVGAGSMADATIIYCEQGQTDSHATGPNPHNGLYNYGSHKKGNSGGTNVLFADTHVDWVEGTRVGWP